MRRWHQVEKVFVSLEEFRATATRKGKTDRNFAVAIHLVTGVVAAT